MEYRIRFSKTGNARYISHLDLNRCMIRAVRRACLPAWYTEGFHPHMYIMFPLALSLGAESLCEYMDIRLTEEIPEQAFLSRLNAVLPDGLKADSVGIPRAAAVEIGSADYRIALLAEMPGQLAGKWSAFLSQEQILVEKKTKKGIKKIDIRPQVQLLSCEAQEDVLVLRLRLPAGNEGNLNAGIVIEAFQKYAEQPFRIKSILREKIFCRNGEEFL